MPFCSPFFVRNLLFIMFGFISFGAIYGQTTTQRGPDRTGVHCNVTLSAQNYNESQAPFQLSWHTSPYSEGKPCNLSETYNATLEVTYGETGESRIINADSNGTIPLVQAFSNLRGLYTLQLKLRFLLSNSNSSFKTFSSSVVSAYDCDCFADGVGGKTPMCRNNGKCHCKSNYGGSRCEDCDPSYYKDLNNMCVACPCSKAKSNGTCHLVEAHGEPVCDRCLPGYAGLQCVDCAVGYHASLSHEHDSDSVRICLPCNCTGNEDPTKPACEDITARCKLCLYNTTGDHCEFCLPGYIGDPKAKNCSLPPRVESVERPSYARGIIIACIAALVCVLFGLLIYGGMKLWRKIRRKRFNFFTIQLRADQHNDDWEDTVNFVLPEYQQGDPNCLLAGQNADDLSRSDNPYRPLTY